MTFRASKVQILMFALKKSTDFEAWLASRFPSREYEEIVPDDEKEGGAGGGKDDEEDEMTPGGRRKSQRYG